MLQGKCLLCFTANRQTFDILNTHLQQVLEKIIDSKIEAESLCLCFICHKRMQQCYKLMQLAKTSQCYLNNKLTEKIDVDLEKHQPLLELTTSKMVNISFSQFESNIETDVEVKKENSNVDEREQRENSDERLDRTQGVTENQLKDTSREHYDLNNAPTWIKTEVEGVSIEYGEMEQQENSDERLECTQGVTDDTLKDISSEHDDVKNAITWIKTEVEEVSIEFESLGEINREDDEQMTSEHEETSLEDDYRPECSNIVIAPNTQNVNGNRLMTLYPLKVQTSVLGNMCKFCPYVTKQKSHMLRHLRIHTGEKPFNCDVCDRNFTQKHAMLEHRRTHTGEKPFACDVCERRFTCKRNLKGHMRSHYGKPFSCDLCDKKYSQKCNLTVHKRTHMANKPYVCEICHKGFTRKCYLDDHRKTHSDKKPFSCDICEGSFLHKSSLKNHMIVHTDEFKCDECDKKFSKDSYLTQHKRTHMGFKPYTCDICKKKFSQMGVLNRHKKNRHNII